MNHQRTVMRTISRMPQTIRSLLLLKTQGVTGDQLDSVQGAIDAVSMDLEHLVKQLADRLEITSAILKDVAPGANFKNTRTGKVVQANDQISQIALRSLSERREWRIPFSRLATDSRTRLAWKEFHAGDQPTGSGAVRTGDGERKVSVLSKSDADPFARESEEITGIPQPERTPERPADLIFGVE